MSQAKLVLSETPPPSTPLRFFFTAPLFGLAAAFILLLQGDTAIIDRWSPGLLAITHLLVLGYMAMVMQGALFQIVSVLTNGRPPWVEHFGSICHGTLTAGTLLLGIGLLASTTIILHSAVLLLSLSFGAFIIAIGLGLGKSATRHDAGAQIALSLVSLGITIGLGIWLVLGHATESITLARHLTDIHLAWGLLGWSTILLVTVSYEVVPMFQLTPLYPRWVIRYLSGGLFGALILWSLGQLLPSPALRLTGTLLIATELILFAVVTLWLQSKRKKKGPEATIWFWRLAMGSLLASLMLWGLGALVPDIRSSPSYPLLLGCLAIYGLFISAINGMLYKILPFLTWLHLSIEVTEHKLSRRLVPNIKKIIPDKWAKAQFWLHLVALLFLLAWGGGNDWLLAPAAIAIALSNGALLVNLGQAQKSFRQTRSNIKAAATAPST